MSAATTAEAPGKSLTFDVEGRTIEVELPPPGSAPSVMVLGLPKAGSTLLHGMMESLAEPAGLTYFALAQKMYTSGVLPPQVPAEASSLFVPEGYLFGGFRGVPPAIELPSWSAGRTILLVRDPRDMMTSLYFSHAFSHRPPGGEEDGAARQQFEKQRAEAQATSIDDYVLERHKRIVNLYRQMKRKLARISHKTYRYEDVIFEKTSWLKDIVKTLGLRVGEDWIDANVARFDVVPQQENPDKHIRRVTPGDFQDKLKPETIAKLDDAFAEIYRDHGYARAS